MCIKKLIFLIVLFTLVGTTAFALIGSGTEEDPFQIINLSNLIEISADSTLWDSFFEQTADIDASSTSTLNEGAGFSPIGYHDYSDSRAFTGSYDGQGFTISNLYINRPNIHCIGLFGYIYGANISNLALVDNTIIGYMKVGGLVGLAEANSIINNCNTTGSVSESAYNVGGLVGSAEYSTISNSYATGDVSSNETVGGLVGYSEYSTITNSYATGAVSGYFDVGGLVGFSQNFTITHSYATGNVSGGDHVGGFIGYCQSTISDCYSTGDVSGNESVGGFIGNSISPISNSYATGDVIGNESVGGLVGSSGSYNTINNSYAIGDVSGEDYVGGLAGSANNSAINNCYATGFVSGNVVGGFLGLNNFESTITNSFWDTESSGQATSAGGTGKTTLEMKEAATYLNAGWDFCSIWSINSGINSGYPYFGTDTAIFNVSIPNNTTDVSITPTISFEVAEGYLSYELYFGETPNAINQLIALSSVNNPIVYTITEALEYYTDYYWKVVLYDNSNVLTTVYKTFTTKHDFGGNGTAEDPYHVENIADLIEISADSTLWDRYFEQTADIDASITSTLNDGAGFSPIGYHGYFDSRAFTGSYDGQAFTISNLYINRPNIYYTGLFGYITTADISNIGLVDNEVIGHFVTGGLVGYSEDSIMSNNYVTGSVSGVVEVGGLVGRCEGSTIINNYATITVNGTDEKIGALVGRANNSSISNSYATGTVTGVSDVGGLVGLATYSPIIHSYATGTVTGVSDVGGLVGLATYSPIIHSYATGTVSGVSDVGGLVGYASDSPISNSYATGSVSGNMIIGGLAGSAMFNSIISNCYATGSVSGNMIIGGLAGRAVSNSIISNCYAVGEVSGTGSTVGGLVGMTSQEEPLVNSFWDIESSGQTTSGGGIGKTTLEMQTISTYLNAGWDFAEETDNGTDDIWTFEANDYPHLTWEESGAIPNDYSDVPVSATQLFRNYPNPFNPVTTITFNLNKNQNVKLDIYNIKGQKVTTLCKDKLKAGTHKYLWNGRDKNNRLVASGIYFAKITSEGLNKTQKMILMK